MNLNLGTFSLSIKRSEAAESAARGEAERVAASAGGLLPWPPGGIPIVYPSGSIGRENTLENLRHIRETVAACMHARSEAIGRGKFHAMVTDSGKRITDKTGRSNFPLSTIHSPLPSDHPLSNLLRQPNPIFDMSDLLELSSQWLDATGNAIWLKVRDGAGRVVELWPASALSFQIERGADGLPESYRFLPSNAIIPASDVIHIRRPDIRMSPFFGHGMISDMLETAKAETAVRLFQSRFFDNDATPRAVLRWPPGALMTQDEMDRLRLAWEAKYATPANAGRIGILPDGGEVQLLGPGGKELDFSKSKEELANAIRQAFRVPKIVFGDTERVNLANADTSYTVFLRDVVDHALAKHAQAFTRALASEFETPAQAGRTAPPQAGGTAPPGSIVIEHESVVPESEDVFMARVKELKQAMTIDEQRALIGLGPLPNGVGTALILGDQIAQQPN